MAKILIVDDEAIVREVLNQKLESWGYDVALSCDGDEALARTEHEGFDLIVSDSAMVRMSGSELCKALKQSERTQDIPVIMLGAIKGDKEKAYEAGAVHYLDKPFQTTDLQDHISKALA